MVVRPREHHHWCGGWVRDQRTTDAGTPHAPRRVVESGSRLAPAVRARERDANGEAGEPSPFTSSPFGDTYTTRSPSSLAVTVSRAHTHTRTHTHQLGPFGTRTSVLSGGETPQAPKFRPSCSFFAHVPYCGCCCAALLFNTTETPNSAALWRRTPADVPVEQCSPTPRQRRRQRRRRRRHTMP